MCNFKNWYFDKTGYVIQCADCNFFKIGFGSILLSMAEKDYRAFFKLVGFTKETHISMVDVHTKCVLLATPGKSVHIILNETELNDLHTMLEEVDIEIKTQSLLDLFSSEEN
jgi:hypothetical protein